MQNKALFQLFKEKEILGMCSIQAIISNLNHTSNNLQRKI